MMMTLGEMLRDMMRKAGIGAQTLSKLTGIPRTAIDNWREGTVRKPRQWRPLVQIARVLSLSTEQTDALLVSAGHPVTAALAAELSPDHPDRMHLAPWLGSPDQTRLRLQLRAPTSDFVGRAEVLDTLMTAVQRHHGTAAIIGIRGMGGAGKTELALLAANRLRSSFPDAQLLLNLRGVVAPVSAAQALRQAIWAFTPGTQLGDDIETLQRNYCAVLSGKRAVILADDAADAAQVRPLMPPPGCVLIVTGRHLFTLPGMTTVDLGQLGETEAAALLQAICPRIPSDLAMEMARNCGYLPLALRIAASLLHNNQAISLPGYLAALTGRRQRLAYLRDPDDALHDVAASLALSHAQLDEPAQSVFRRIGVLAADFTTQLATAVVDELPEVEVESILRLLLRRSMVECDPPSGRWRLHDLVRDLAGGYLESSGAWETTMWRYADACLRIAEETQQQYLSGGDEVLRALARFDAERPHLDAAWQWVIAHAGGDRGDRWLAACSVATDKTSFLRYDLRGEMLPQKRIALAAARRLGDRHSEGVILNQLGHLHINLGEVDQGIVFHQQQLALVRSCGDRTGEVRALNGLAIAYTQLGQLRQAIETNEQHLALVRSMGDSRGEAMARCNLGLAHLYLGEPEQALSYLEPALTAVRQLGDQYGQAVILNNIGEAHLAAGDAPRAAENGESALSLVRAMGDRFLEAGVLADVSSAMVALGQAETGIRYCSQALAIARGIRADQQTAKALLALGQAYVAIGSLIEARAAFEEASAILQVIGDHLGQAECGWHLGLTLFEEQPSRALEMLRAAVSYHQRIGHAHAAKRAATLDRLVASEAHHAAKSQA